MNWQDRITIDPKVLVGKPVVRGTRIAANLVTDLLGQGWTNAQILDNYPALTPDDIGACVEFQKVIADQWDRQIEADILAGRLDAASTKADNDFEAGKCNCL